MQFRLSGVRFSILPRVLCHLTLSCDYQNISALRTLKTKHMNTKKIICSILISCSISAFTQDIRQTIRGSVTDLESRAPLCYATVAVYTDSVLAGAAISDSSGNFRIEHLPVGRYHIVASFMGYRQVVIHDVIINSSREVILHIEMEESPVALNEIDVIASEKKGTAMNKLAFVSSRTFSVEESERYAGSRGDPARMASNFAGVQGNNDSNNDLVIRGNSPLGVLWRLEGVNIPNPNHFGVSGTTGGPVTILNNRVLSVSDFLIGAFPAEYGNSIAGVFDLKMRNGNNETHEFSGQLGFLGTDLTAEGPISRKGRSSYLVSYRYSTLAIFRAIGIRIGTDAVPNYQDASFKLNFPVGKRGNISLFGIGGLSKIDILSSEILDPNNDKIYGDEGMDEHFRTGMGVLGTNYTRTMGSNSLLRVTLSTSKDHQRNHLDKVYRHTEDHMFVIDSIREPYNGYRSDQEKYSLSLSWNWKMSGKHTLKLGLTEDLFDFSMHDSVFNESLYLYRTRLNHEGNGLLSQPYIQWKYKPSGRISCTAGIHGQFLLLGNHFSRSVEPRMGLRYQINGNHSIGFGTGLHSQMLPTYIYFAEIAGEDGYLVRPNAGLDFLRSYHNMLCWDYMPNTGLRLKVETYHQLLYNVPVEVLHSSYSVLDEGHDLNRFFPDSLLNRGKGYNYGIELTLERFFSRSYFFMVTASLYDARRTGSDGICYDAVYNGHTILNALGSREFHWGNMRRSTFTIGGKITLAGNKRYTPIDVEASDITGEVVYAGALRNTMQFRPYFRADVKLNYRLNTRKFTHEAGLDIINLTDRENILKQTYIRGNENPVREVYQLGILPIFYYRIEF